MKKLKDKILNSYISDCRDDQTVLWGSGAFDDLKESLINDEDFLKQLKYDTDVWAGIDLNKKFELEITLLEDKEMWDNESSFLILEFYFSQNEFDFSRKYNYIWKY